MSTQCRQCLAKIKAPELSDILCISCIGKSKAHITILKEILKNHPTATFLLLLFTLVQIFLPWLLQSLEWSEMRGQNLKIHTDSTSHFIVSLLITLILSLQLILSYFYRFFITSQVVKWWKALLIIFTFGFFTLIGLDVIDTKATSLIMLLSIFIFPACCYVILRVEMITPIAFTKKTYLHACSQKLSYPAVIKRVTKFNHCIACNNLVGFFVLKDRLCQICFVTEGDFFDHLKRSKKALPSPFLFFIVFLLLSILVPEQSAVEFYSQSLLDFVALLLPVIVAFIIRFYLIRQCLPFLFAFMISIVLFFNPLLMKVSNLSPELFFWAIPIFMLSTFSILLINNKRV